MGEWVDWWSFRFQFCLPFATFVFFLFFVDFGVSLSTFQPPGVPGCIFYEEKKVYNFSSLLDGPPIKHLVDGFDQIRWGVCPQFLQDSPCHSYACGLNKQGKWMDFGKMKPFSLQRGAGGVVFRFVYSNDAISLSIQITCDEKETRWKVSKPKLSVYNLQYGSPMACPQPISQFPSIQEFKKKPHPKKVKTKESPLDFWKHFFPPVENRTKLTIHTPWQQQNSSNCFVKVPNGILTVGKGSHITEDGSKYEWNLCRPLMTKDKSSTCHGASVCQTTPEGVEFSLGHIEPVFYLPKEALQIDFLGGSLGCVYTFRLARFTLKCSSKVIPPSVIELEPCDYQIILHSPSYCPSWADTIVSKKTGCIVQSWDSLDWYDLSIFPTLSHRTSDSLITFNLCNPLEDLQQEDCTNTHVCQTSKHHSSGISLGDKRLLSPRKGIYPKSGIVVFEGSKCANLDEGIPRHITEIHIVFDPTANFYISQLYGSPCRRVLKVKTSKGLSSSLRYSVEPEPEEEGAKKKVRKGKKEQNSPFIAFLLKNRE